MYAILLAALVAADVGIEPVAAPKGQAPRILTASVKGDQLVSVRQVAVMAPVTVEKEVEVNGERRKVTVTELVTRISTQTETWDLKKATITTAGGKKIDLDDAKKLLAKPCPVIVSSDGRAIDAAYLKLFDKDAMVIVAASTGAPATAPPVYVAPAPPKIEKR